MCLLSNAEIFTQSLMSFGYHDWAVSSFQIKAMALAISNHTHLRQTSSPNVQSVFIRVCLFGFSSDLIMLLGGAVLRNIVLGVTLV